MSKDFFRNSKSNIKKLCNREKVKIALNTFKQKAKDKSVDLIKISTLVSLTLASGLRLAEMNPQLANQLYAVGIGSGFTFLTCIYAKNKNNMRLR